MTHGAGEVIIIEIRVRFHDFNVNTSGDHHAGLNKETFRKRHELFIEFLINS